MPAKEYMPELPEVEIVCRNLAKMIKPSDKILSWIFFRANLRYKIPKAQLRKIIGRPLVNIERRAKYILFNFGEYILVSHLGMTGSWRQEKINWQVKKHDHLAFEISNDRYFVFEDPRRFGFIEAIKAADLKKRFIDLGVEPLSNSTDFKQLTQKFKILRSPIKTAIMNQKLLVGVGNIYASEVLFRVQISPFKTCAKVSEEQYIKIWKEIVILLHDAIIGGGSTIENYRNSFGKKGSFQNSLFVYARKNQPCFKCQVLIKSIIQAGRSTFWCPNCQKK